MASATHSSTAAATAAHGVGHAHIPPHHAPVTPGKVAMWLFLATEVMFFTGLIGSYIVLAPAARMTPTAISTPRRRRSRDSRIPTESCSNRPGPTTSRWSISCKRRSGLSEGAARKLVEEVPHALVSRLKGEKAEQLLGRAQIAGCRCRGRAAQDLQMAPAL